MSSEKTLSSSRSKGQSNYKLFFNRINWKIIMLLLLPVILIYLSADWIFSWPLKSCIDAWIYFGYFLDLKQHLNTFAGTYYGTRPPWILPGFLAYKLFAPLTATYVLHFGFYWAATISLFQILKQTLDRRTALLTAVLMGSYHYFLEAMGTAYIDGAGLTYFLLTLLMLTKAATSKNFQIYLSFAGVFFACLVYTQLFLTTYFPLVVLYYVFMNYERQQHPLFKSFGFFVLGFTGITAILCTINYFLNGTFFFFMPIVQWTAHFVTSGVNPWWSPISSWWTRAVWLFLPAFAFFGSAAILICYKALRNVPNRRMVLFFQIYFLLNFLLFVFMELKTKQPMLNLPYYSSYMIPALFLALGSQLSLAISVMNRRKFYFFLVFTILVLTLGFIFPKKSYWPFSLTFNQLALPAAAGVLGVASILFKSRISRQAGALLITLSLTAANMLMNNSTIISYNAKYQKNSLLSVVESAKVIKKWDPKATGLFWYEGYQAPVSSIYRSVASTYLWGYRLINEDFPSVVGKVVSRKPVLNDRIFIISQDENSLELANKNLAQIGLRGELIDKKTIQKGEISYNITFFQVCNL